MNHKTEIDIVLYYLNNLLKRPLYGDLEEHVCDWFEKNSRELIGRDVENDWEGRRRWQQKHNDEVLLPRDSLTLKIWLEGKSGRFVLAPEVKAIIDAFHLSPECHNVLAQRVYVASIPLLNNLADTRHDTPRERLLADMLNLPLNRMGRFFSNGSELIEKGLFHLGGCRGDLTPNISETLTEIIVSYCRTPNAVKRVVLGKPQTATLGPEHFEHLEEEYVWIRNLLSRGLSTK